MAYGRGVETVSRKTPWLLKAFPASGEEMENFSIHLTSRCRQKTFQGENTLPGNRRENQKKDYRSALKFSARLVISMDFAGSFSIPVIARIQSIFSTTTSASWWIAWKR